MDPNDLRKKITRRTKAIIPVHLYGHMAYMDEILEIAKKKNIKIIEDASQSLGSKFKGKHSGTFSHLGCFSLYGGKVITSGEGGAIVTDDKKLLEKLRQIRNHGMTKNNLITTLGLNLRLSEINAAIAKIQMKKLPHLINERKKNAQNLTDLLKDYDIILPKQRKNETRNWYLYTVALKNRDKAMKKLNASGIGAMIYYSTPIHKTSYYKTKLSLPNTEWAASHVLSLPVHPKVRKPDLARMKKVLSDSKN
jgi:dTDP-4-amino-4,6-dideoxygalactose transaminase